MAEQSVDVAVSIRRAIVEVLADAGRPVAAAPQDSAGLLSSGVGLDSLDFAVLVVKLERQLGCDPFRSGRADRMPRTVGELIALYVDSRSAGSAG